METKLKHGGKRPGAGRPINLQKAPGRFVFRCTDEEYEIIRNKAEERNASINQYLIDKGIE